MLPERRWQTRRKRANSGSRFPEPLLSAGLKSFCDKVELWSLSSPSADRLIIQLSTKLFHYRFGIVSDFGNCNCDFFFRFSKLLDSLRRNPVGRKIDSASIWLGLMNELRHVLMVHDEAFVHP